MEDKILVIYHKEDNDGLFSAAIVINYFIHELKCNKQNIIPLGVDYDDLTNMSDCQIFDWKLQYKYLVMTDVCFNDTKKMVKLKQDFGSRFIWIDHHAPVIKESFKLKFDDVEGERNTEYSALLNAYKFCYDPINVNRIEGKIPELLRILSAYDSWSYEREGYTQEYVMAVNKAVTYTYNLDLDKCIDVCYKILYTDIIGIKDIGAFYTLGSGLINYDKSLYKNLVNYYGDFSWKLIDDNGNERKLCVLFYQAPTGSYVFESVKDKIDSGAIFKRLRNGNWVISLYNVRNEDEFHCGEYCKKKYKGGGHKGAAGCQVTEAKFKKMLKSKTI